ncbi:hypothetical protein VTJ49DRAFT_2490 [Mycothermus thermophilus]|uniref:Phosphatidylinositol-specific phospholipase C X domain-containing protein n=1 Tax=Humicola insolens TaxID=85995 RepID=A0ABR3VA43_HUMIN
MADPTTLTIRNLTITPLRLALAERLNVGPDPSLNLLNGLTKLKSCLGGSRSSTEEREDPERQDLSDVVLESFSEIQPPIKPPRPEDRHDRLRLTFEDSSTGHRYTCEIPPSSRRSIVLQPHHQDDAPKKEAKEFTAIYLPGHSYLTLFSSANLSSWMSNLSSSLPLSALSIPGTHNSPTCHVALPSVRCQAVPVVDQLNNGVRFLDVRVSCPPFNSSSNNNNPDILPAINLSLVHSAFPVALFGRKYLSSLLSTLYDFLAAHPSETILLSLKREGTGKGTDADLARFVHCHSRAAGSERWYTSPRIPTLGECRGRIVLVRRYGLHDSSVPHDEAGIDGSAWPDNVADGMCGSGTIRIQDYYGVGNRGEIQTKIRFAQEGLERAAQGIHARRAEDVPAPGPTLPLFINFLSASNFFNASCWPDRIAVKINPSMIEYLCMHHGAPQKGPGKLDIGDSATGIVVTDWVGHRGDWDLIRCIVGWNARLQLQQ